jgi:hypothetical protein
MPPTRPPIFASKKTASRRRQSSFALDVGQTLRASSLLIDFKLLPRLDQPLPNPGNLFPASELLNTIVRRLIQSP